jgi:RNA polymerase sigma-70 factor (ECF subfamily)
MVETSLSLLEQLRGGNGPPQWDQLVEIYRPLLRSWLSRHGELSSADADDLVQDALLTISQELAGFQHNGQPGAFRKWLRLIVVNRLRSFWRARRQEPQAVGGSEFLGQLAELEDDASGPSRLWDREHDRQVMCRLLEQARPRFAPQTWLAFRLQVMEGLKADEVARRLGLSVNSVYVAKARVLQILRRLGRGLVS